MVVKMQYQRILIIGNSGSGKSTLAVRLGETLGLPVTHLDQLFWQDGWVSVSGKEFDRRLEERLSQPAWVMDGNYDRTLPWRMERCDAIVLLDFNRFTCMTGVLKRIFHYRGRTRPDMGEGCPERIDVSFLIWILWTFPRTKRRRDLELIRKHPDKKAFILKRRSQIPELIRQMQSE